MGKGRGSPKEFVRAVEAVDRQTQTAGVRYPLAGAVVMLVVAKLSGKDEWQGVAEGLKLRAAMFVEVLAGLPRK
jgi:hypothetical protein